MNKKMDTMRGIKNYIIGYIDTYLENDDELAIMNEEKFRRIQKDEQALNNIATLVINNEVLKSYEDVDTYYYELQYWIDKYLNEAK